MIAIKLNAKNDRNGNPRRVFVLLSSAGRVLDTADEEYRGDEPLRELIEKWCPIEHTRDQYLLHIPQNCPTFETTPREYRELVKFGEE